MFYAIVIVDSGGPETGSDDALCFEDARIFVWVCVQCSRRQTSVRTPRDRVQEQVYICVCCKMLVVIVFNASDLHGRVGARCLFNGTQTGRIHSLMI